MEDDIYVAGGVDIPDDLIDHALVWTEWSPRNNLERHLVQLIVLHPDVVDFRVNELQTMTEDEQAMLLTVVNEKLGIKPLREGSLGG